MREILFKAKAINRKDYYRSNYKNGDWVYGLITKQYNARYDFPAIMTNENGISGIEVDYKTLSQYTGLKDKNGKMIFEGDVVKCYDDFTKKEYKAIVEFGNPNGEYNWGWQLVFEKPFHCNSDILCWVECEESGAICEVIGNKFDNPELLTKE